MRSAPADAKLQSGMKEIKLEDVPPEPSRPDWANYNESRSEWRIQKGRRRWVFDRPGCTLKRFTIYRKDAFVSEKKDQPLPFEARWFNPDVYPGFNIRDGDLT
mgnify:CR=1 FL=1